jgi:hypothetical protein
MGQAITHRQLRRVVVPNAVETFKGVRVVEIPDQRL